MKLKFLNVNIFDGGMFWDNLREFLVSENPDILAVQEVFGGKDESLPENLRSADRIAELFAEYEVYFAPELKCIYEEGYKVDIGNAIYSRFPIVSREARDFGIPYGEFDRDPPPPKKWGIHPKNIQCAQIDVEGTEINVCNLHGIWDLDGEKDSPERLAMSEIIVDMIKDKERVILSGDFNVQPNTETIGNIEKHLTNVFKGELTTSFNLKRKDLEKYPGYASAVVDMVFVSDDIEVVSHECPQVDVSDHLPQIVEVEI